MSGASEAYSEYVKCCKKAKRWPVASRHVWDAGWDAATKAMGAIDVADRDRATLVSLIKAFVSENKGVDTYPLLCLVEWFHRTAYRCKT